jgi:hypothetical protein
LVFGYAIFDPYAHAIEDPDLGTIITLKSMGMIHQTTIEKWKIECGEVKEIYQNVITDGFTPRWIQAKDLVILVNEQEGDNFEGMSILRPIYGNYIRKDLDQKLMMIGAEKSAVGTPTVYVPSSWLTSTTSPDMDALRLILRNYTSHQDAYLILPDKLKDGGFTLEKNTFDGSALLDMIREEKADVMASILASFLDIGISKSGGNSQNQGQMALFLNALQSIAEEVIDVMDDIAHDYYVLNFGIPKVRLDMTISGITMDSVKDMIASLRNLATGALIEPDEMLEKMLRIRMDLPAKDSKTARTVFSKPSQAGQGGVDKSIHNDNPTPDSERIQQQSPEAGV